MGYLHAYFENACVMAHPSDQNNKKLYNFFERLELGKMRVELKLIVLFQVIFVLQSLYKVPRAQIAAGLADKLFRPAAGLTPIVCASK
jgi:hypothetical protein